MIHTKNKNKAAPIKPKAANPPMIPPTTAPVLTPPVDAGVALDVEVGS
jgi:hypothetical protein